MAQPSGIPAFSSITFGVGLEVPLLNNIENILRAGECADRKTRLRASAKLITPELEKAKIRYSTEFWDGTEEAIWVDHRRWHIGEDPTTYQPWTKGVGPLELKSPAWKADEVLVWKEQLKTVENILDPHLARERPKTFQLCSTHMHVSFPDHQNNEKDELKGVVPVGAARLIMLAAFLFEGVIDDLVPEKSDPNRFAKPNTKIRDTDKPTPENQLTGFREVWNQMRGFEKIQDLHKMVCWEAQYGGRGAYHDRHFKWNLSGGSSSELKWKTIEFRQLPPLTHRGEAVTWVNFMLGFISAATSIDPVKLTEAAAAGNDKKILKLYGLEKPPTGFADIQRFILTSSKYLVDEKLLSRVPAIKDQVKGVWNSHAD